MAALAGLRIDNALVEIDGPEMPIMDGSAADFVDAIDSVGLAHAIASAPIYPDSQVRCGSSPGAPIPNCAPPAAAFASTWKSISTPRRSAVSAASSISIPQVFRKEIARARTFGFVSDVKKLWQAGFALGSSLENSIALDGDAVLNPEGLRFSDEFVRHKTLDAIGDLALAGAPIIGCYHAYRPGHKMNAMMLSALFADRKALRNRRELAAQDLCGRRRGDRAGRHRLCAPTSTESLPIRFRPKPSPRDGVAARFERRAGGATRMDRAACARSVVPALSRHNPSV